MVNKQLQYTLANISRNKDSQTMKFDLLLEYTWETFLLKNHTKNVVILIPFSKKLKIELSLD